MTPTPKGCRARYEMMQSVAAELLETFINGNRKDLLKGLLELEPATGLAVLSRIMNDASHEVRNDIKRFLTEVA